MERTALYPEATTTTYIILSINKQNVFSNSGNTAPRLISCWGLSVFKPTNTRKDLKAKTSPKIPPITVDRISHQEFLTPLTSCRWKMCSGAPGNDSGNAQILCTTFSSSQCQFWKQWEGSFDWPRSCHNQWSGDELSDLKSNEIQSRLNFEHAWIDFTTLMEFILTLW